MGIALVEEVMDYAPATLKPMEWKGLIVLARDANDRTRLVFHGVNDPEILHRMGVSKSRWDSIRGGLLAAGVLVYARRADGSEIRGNAGGAARFLIPNLREHPEARVVAGFQHPSEMPAGIQQPPVGGRLLDSGRHPGRMGAGIQQERVPKSGTPTPLLSSTTLLPTVAPVPEQRSTPGEAGAGGEGGVDAANEHSREFTALATVLADIPKLTLGTSEIEPLTALVTPWLERATPEHLRAALVQGIPEELIHPASYVRLRLLKKLPPPVTKKQESSGAECAQCRHLRPVAVQHDGRPYCARCTEVCTGCGTCVPEVIVLDDLCAECRKDE
ncbi:hypothetical protein [Streptomyces sp. NPDC001205]